MSSNQPSERELFWAFCLAHLKARPERGYISGQACRILFEKVKAHVAKTPSVRLEDVTIDALDMFPYRHIDLDVLEKYELVARKPQYALSGTGEEFKFRKILADAIVGGVPKALMDWVPTWEPVGNVPNVHMKAFRDKKRTKRKKSRAVGLLNVAHKNKYASG